MRLPTTAIEYTRPLVPTRQRLSAPVLASKAAMLWRATDFDDPSGAPGGRTALNSPATYIRPFENAIERTWPFVCQVGVGGLAARAVPPSTVQPPMMHPPIRTARSTAHTIPGTC